MRYIHYSLFAALLTMSSSCMAFKCYLTLMKSKCWNKHNVTFNVIDNDTDKTILENMKLDQNTLWIRKEFNCTFGQGLITKATFSPYVWESDKNKEYRTKRIWFLPLKKKKKSIALNIPICFPNHFSDVPMLPNVDTLCDCESTSQEVPPLPVL